MKKKLFSSKNTLLQIFLSFFIVILIFLIFISPQRFVNAAANGIQIWWINILPAVLPFMLFSKMLTSLGVLENIGVSRYTFLVSIMSGYPVGAKMCSDLYTSGKISKQKAQHMLSYCSNSGPMFMLGTVGIGMLFSAAAGYIIFISHIIGAILNGTLYYYSDKSKVQRSNFIKPNFPVSSFELATSVCKKTLHNDTKKTESLNDIITSSVLGILSVGAIVMLFAVVIEAANPLLELFPSWLSSPLIGIIEMTYGAHNIAKTFTLPAATVLCSFVISFGGLSTIVQSMALIQKTEVKPSRFFLFKLTHGIFAAASSLLMVLIFL